MRLYFWFALNFTNNLKTTISKYLSKFRWSAYYLNCFSFFLFIFCSIKKVLTFSEWKYFRIESSYFLSINSIYFHIWKIPIWKIHIQMRFRWNVQDLQNSFRGLILWMRNCLTVYEIIDDFVCIYVCAMCDLTIFIEFELEFFGAQ